MSAAMTELRYCGCCGEVQILCPECREWHSVKRVVKRGNIYEIHGKDMYAEITTTLWERVEIQAKSKCKSLKNFPIVVIKG
jgi:hypothetical protein